MTTQRASEQRTGWILGLNHGIHDAAAVLLRDGELAVMIEQERLSRRKGAFNEAPVDALRYCLDYAGLTLDQVDGVALASDLDRFAQWLGLDGEERRRQLIYDDPDRLFPVEVFGSGQRPSPVPVRHHLAHAASAFWLSGFDEAAVLVVDKRGEDSSAMLAHGVGTEFRVLESIGVAESLGLYYQTATQYAGLYDESSGGYGKLMGLAAYGRPDQPAALCVSSGAPAFEALPSLADLPGREVAMTRASQLLDYFTDRCFPYTVGLRDEVLAYANFAASVQRSLEDVLLALAGRLHTLTGSRRLVVAGGVGLNCSANGAVARSGLFDDVFVQPVAHDAGAALGAALELSRRLRPGSRPGSPMTHAYWGPSFDQGMIDATLERHGVGFELLDESTLIEQVADLLARGSVVGWFQGRAEVGPRALGARSLLGDPRTRRTLVRLNRIKGREMWRPVAPSVLHERFSRYFVDAPPNPFMIVSAWVRDEVRALVPAIVHVDGSARPQAVTAEANPRYWRLIAAFERRTGVPLVVNTSFNLQGEPIVNTPDEAVRDFLQAGIDALAIGDALALKR